MEIELLEEGELYHIFNRGINREDIFREPMNYDYFLRKYRENLTDVVDTLAYCLLKNHFHLFVQVKQNVIVPKRKGEGFIKSNASRQFGHLFKGYAQGFNKVYKRTGGLFESPLHRTEVASEDYITSLFFYIHTNAGHHGLVTDFKDWPYTSYHDVLNRNNSIVNCDYVLDWFGGEDRFRQYHSCQHVLVNPSAWMLEDE